MRASCLILYFGIAVLSSAEALTLFEKISPDGSNSSPIQFTVQLRDTGEGTVARIEVRSRKEFPKRADVVISEIVKTPNSVSTRGILKIEPKRFGKTLVAEFPLTDEISGNKLAAFHLTIPIYEMVDGKEIGMPSADVYWLALSDFLPDLSVVDPKVGGSWKKRDGKSIGNKKWTNFDHVKNGDVLSFQTWKVNSKTKLESSPVLQSSIETFRSYGSAAVSSKEKGYPILEMLRWQITEMVLGKEKVEVLEFSYLYGSDGSDMHDEASSIGHGYIALFDGIVYSLQHTSKRLVSSETAFEMMYQTLRKNIFPHPMAREKADQLFPGKDRH